MGGAGGRNEARNERPGRWYGPMRAPGRSAPAPPRRLRETRTAHGDPRVCTSMYVCVCVCVCPCAAPPRRPPPRRSGSGRHMAARRCHQHAKMAALTPPARPCCVTPPPAPPRARRFPGGSAEVGAEDASVPSQRSAAASGTDRVWGARCEPPSAALRPEAVRRGTAGPPERGEGPAGLSAGRGETGPGMGAFKSVRKHRALEPNPWTEACAGRWARAGCCFERREGPWDDDRSLAVCLCTPVCIQPVYVQPDRGDVESSVRCGPRFCWSEEAVAVCTGFPKVGFLTELCLLFLQQQMM
eukprot:XP_025008859.1 uncharacterized protein LOC101749837 isoform X4 [Gallus gallus]